ncbi:MAG: hypothetical protein H6733_07875 [Alphaproteobacteria bacterium]|nr:hypothetical protein [Alphaproteobacteria bacterium]
MDHVGLLIIETLAAQQGTTPDDLVTRWALDRWAAECHRAGAAGEPVPTLVSSGTLTSTEADPAPTAPADAPADAPDTTLRDLVLDAAGAMSVPFASRAIVQAVDAHTDVDEVHAILTEVGWPHREQGKHTVWQPR